MLTCIAILVHVFQYCLTCTMKCQFLNNSKCLLKSYSIWNFIIFEDLYSDRAALRNKLNLLSNQMHIAYMVHIVNLIRLKWCIHLSRSLFLNFNYLVSVTACGPVSPRGHM